MKTPTLVETLESSLREVVEFFQRFDASELDEPVTASEHPGGRPWSPKDHLAHLVQREMDFLPIARRIVERADPLRLGHRGETPAERTAYVNRENQAAVDRRQGQTLSDLLESLVGARMELVSIVGALADDHLERSITLGPERVVVAADLFATTTRHAKAHVAMLDKAKP
jgi:hypothetical protein